MNKMTVYYLKVFFISVPLTILFASLSSHHPTDLVTGYPTWEAVMLGVLSVASFGFGVAFFIRGMIKEDE